jgi:beta-galactosidase
MNPTDPIWIGASYYPEHVSPERVEADAVLMREAGLNLVRMGDFAWIRMEPEEGCFDFSWLDHAVRVLAGQGVSSLLCTPTAAPSKWISDKDPEVCQTMADGRRREFGRRRHYCVNSRAYRRHTERMVRALAEHYRGNPQVIGYQIDNEIMAEDPYCYCETCRKDFQGWLERRHGSIEELNRVWVMVFWSQSYRGFGEVSFPKTGHNPAALMDFYRFFSECYLDYIRFQAGLIREYSPGKRVTHNICSSGFVYRMDLNELGREMDVMSIDNYPYNWTLEHEYGNKVDLPYSPAMAGFALSMTRNYQGGHFWVTEAQVGRCYNPRKIVEPGMMRLWTYQELAHGGSAFLFFSWRTFPYGIEYLMHGVLDQDSVPRRRYHELQRTARELAALDPCVKAGLPHAEVALVREFDCDWAFEDGHVNVEFRYLRHLFLYHEACSAQHHTLDVLRCSSIAQRHKVVIAPSLLIATPEREKTLRDFVARGGRLVLTCLSGLRTEANTLLPQLLSPGLRELAGIEIEEQLGLRPGLGVGLRWSEPECPKIGYSATLWADLINPAGARTLAVYADQHFAGSPAVTVNRHGEGLVYYVATVPDAEFVSELIGRVLGEAGVQSPIACDESLVEAVVTRSGEREFLHLMNFAGKPVMIALRKLHGAPGGGAPVGELSLQARDAVILERCPQRL